MSTEQDALDAISIAGHRLARADQLRDEAMTHLRDTALAALEDHPRLPETAIAEAAGVARTTVRRWRGKGR